MRDVGRVPEIFVFVLDQDVGAGRRTWDLGHETCGTWDVGCGTCGF
jgi:hypothetical protein